ncbi:MAG: zinc-finger domain-containing protein [Rudaea sp.]
MSPINPSVATAASTLIPANAENRYTVTRADVPLSCPMPGMTLWNSHPKVYLPIEASGAAKCPYCGAQYTLAG